MVKVSIKVVRDAQYEAQQRTVEVSNKPAVGKMMFSDQLNQAAEGSFKGSFETERFVHGKIREFTLRSASHWTEVRAIVPDNTARIPNSSAKEIEDALMYRVIAESVDHALGNAVFAHIPKGLRVYVLAKMIQDSDMSIMNHDKEDRASLQARLRFREVLKRTGFNLDAGLLIAAFISSKQTLWTALLCGLASSELQSVSMDCKRNVPALTHKGSRTDSVKLEGIELASSSSRTPQYGVASRMEAGFGTAPIWYQQSMATGPPLQSSRWKTRAKLD